MSHEFDLSRMVILPGRKLAGLRFVLKNVPEALPALIETAAKHRAQPLYFASSISAVTDGFPVLVFLDLSEADLGIADLAMELESNGIVRNTEIIKPGGEGLIIDNLSHPITVGGDRAIILRELAYRRLFNSIREQFGSGGEAFLYYGALEMGRGFGKIHKTIAEAVGLKDPVEIYRRVSTAMFQWAGFGRIEIIHIGDSGGKVAVYDSFECQGAKVTGKPYSALVRGIITGVFAELFGKPFEVVETECIAKGNPRCAFEIRAKQ